MYMVLIGDQAECTMRGHDAALGDAFHGALGPQAVPDQIGDGADTQSVLTRKTHQFGLTGHRPVIAHDLDDHGGRLEARESGEITARLGVPGACQHAARLRHQREDMPRLAQVLGSRTLGHRCTHRVGAVVGGDAGRHALSRLDREREVGPVVAVGVAHHERQAQLPAALAGERGTDQPAAEARHEVDVLGSHLGRSHQEIALVLAVFIVEDHDHATRSKIGEDVFDAVEAAVRRAARQVAGAAHAAQAHAVSPAPARRST